MTRPTINVNSPTDNDPIGEGAERIRETRQALYDIFPIKKEDLDPGMKPDGSVSKEYVDGQDLILQNQIDTNKESIESNESDIGANAENIASNAIEISSNTDLITENTGDIADLDVRVTKNEGDIETLEAKSYRLETDANLRATPMIQLVDQDNMYSDVAMVAGSGINIVSGPSSMTFSATESGIGLDNSEPWTHAQYNTLVDAPITNDGSGAPRSTLDLQVNPNVKVSPSSGGAVTLCTIFSGNVDKDGIYANILLDPVATYTFDASKFVVDDINESKWLYVRVISSSGRWFQIGSNYLGEPGGLGGGGTDVYTEHLNATVEDTTIVSTNNALSAGPVQLDNVVTVESGAVWVIV